MCSKDIQKMNTNRQLSREKQHFLSIERLRKCRAPTSEGGGAPDYVSAPRLPYSPREIAATDDRLSFTGRLSPLSSTLYSKNV